MQPWNLVFLIGFIAYMGIRGVFERRTQGTEKMVRRFDACERILLVMVILTSLLLPMLYLFTPWLTFADYRLPAFVPWCGDGGCALAVLAVSFGLGCELVGHVGTSQRPSIGHAGRLPVDPASDVCLDLVV